jgi:hypothetical protein
MLDPFHFENNKTSLVDNNVSLRAQKNAPSSSGQGQHYDWQLMSLKHKGVSESYWVGANIVIYGPLDGKVSNTYHM